MPASTSHHIRVSPALFELATDCIRLASNKHRRFASISEVVADGIKPVEEMLRDDQASLRDHLATLPASGLIALSFELDATGQAAFERLLAQARPILRSASPKTEALSLLLFAYLVDCRAVAAAEALAQHHHRHGADTSDAKGSVVPFIE